MVKPPRIRHSKSRKEAVTIDLEAGDVKRVAEPEAAAAAPGEDQVASTVPDESVTAEGSADEAASDRGRTQSEREAGDEAARPQETNLFDAAPDSPSADPSVEQAFGRAAAPKSAATESRTGGMSAVVGGVVGAVIALAGAGALQWGGVLPGPRGADATGASLEVLRGEIGVLRQEIADSRAAAENSASAETVARSGARIEELDAALGQLRTEVQNLQSSVPQEGDEGNPEAVQALETRLTQLETRVAALPRGAEDSGELNQRIASVEDAQRAAAEKAAADVSRLERLEKSIADLSQKVEEQAAEPGMMLAVAAAALKSAIDRGTPFMTELETYAAIAPDSPDIAALRDLAASGVPTHAQIEAELGNVADRMIAATRPVDPNAGFLDQLWSSAQSLVQVRPVGQVEGEGAPAMVARMEVALRDGNYEKALQEYEALPEPARTAGEEFTEKVRARHTADQLVARALSGALKAPGSEG